MIINFSKYNYVRLCTFTGDLENDVCSMLENNNKSNIKNHVLNVARVSEELSQIFNVDNKKAYKAALLHDISAIIKPSDMITIAKENNMYLDEAEIRYPFLLHQRISKIIANECFNIDDEKILSAIECHTTLKSNCSKEDMVLFIADKIAWDQLGEPPYIDVVNSALKISLNKACKDFLDYQLCNNKILYPHIWLKEAYDYLK